MEIHILILLLAALLSLAYVNGKYTNDKHDR